MLHTAIDSADPAPPMPAADVKAFDVGAFLLVYPLSDEAEAWLRDNLVGDNIWRRHPASKYGELRVEHRYGPDLLRGMMDEGLCVYLDGRRCDG
jgi:hypothetical protein